MNKRILLTWLLLSAITLSGCQLMKSQTFCTMPETVELSDIVGTWIAHYDDHWVLATDSTFRVEELMSGTEILTFSENGIYTQTFLSETYRYVSVPGRWSLDTSALDSPKLTMQGMKYFPGGEIRAESDVDVFDLYPQTPDKFRYQDAHQRSEFVHYPSSGFVYLYLRSCWGNLLMQQMIYGFHDPDDYSITNPVFRRN